MALSLSAPAACDNRKAVDAEAVDILSEFKLDVFFFFFFFFFFLCGNNAAGIS